MINLLLHKPKLVAKNRNIKSYKNPGWSAGDMRQWPKKKEKKCIGIQFLPREF